jgi:hypothetical protein
MDEIDTAAAATIERDRHIHVQPEQFRHIVRE